VNIKLQDEKVRKIQHEEVSRGTTEGPEILGWEIAASPDRKRYAKGD